MKVLKLAFLSGLIFTISVINAKEITLKNIKISFSDKKGKINTSVKVVYANGENAYLIPLDADKKKFTELKYSKISGNKFHTVYYSKANGVVSYSYTLDKSGYIKVQTSSYNCYLQLQLKADALIIPDQVTNDELFWMGSKQKKLRIPGDNHFFVELLSNGNAMLCCLWDSPEQEITANFKKVTFTCAPGNNIYFGFLAKNNIWYKPNAKLTNKYISTNWVPPFNAVWHMLFKRDKGRLPIENGISDMWVLYNKNNKKNNIYQGMGLGKPKEMQAWASGMGWIGYPCFVDNNKTHLRLPQFKNDKFKKTTYSGTQVIYPFSGVAAANMLLPLDAVRKFLGKECMNKVYMTSTIRTGFPATCGVTGEIEKIFYRGNQEVKLKKYFMKKRIYMMDIFVYVINSQIKENIKFTRSLQLWLKDKKKYHPRLKELVDKHAKELEQINRYYVSKKEKIKTPLYYMTLSQKLNNIIDSKLDEEEKEIKIKALCRKIRTIGGNQDSTSALQRLYIKAIKQQVTLALTKTKDPEKIEFFNQFRRKLHQRLRIMGVMEGK